MNNSQSIRNNVLLVIFYMTVLITLFIHAGDDTYWHIPVGEWIVNHMEVPRHGIFSQTKENSEWLPHEWLSEVITYLVYKWLGWAGLVMLGLIAVTASILIALNYLMEKLPLIRAFCLILLSYGLLLSHIMPRPHIFILPIMTYWFVQLLRASEQHKVPSWHNFLLLILWANMHGSFLISLPYMFYFAFESVITAPAEIDINRLIKKWAVFIVISLLCLLVTPFGIEGLLFPLEMTNLKYATSIISEWAPFNFGHFEFFELWILIVICFALTQKIKIPYLRLLFLLGLIHLSLKHCRYAFDLLSLQGSLLLASPLAKHWNVSSEQAGDKLRILTLLPVTKQGRALFLAAICGLFIYIFAFKDALIDYDKKSIAMLGSLRQFEPLGKVFNSLEMCGFLMYQGYKPYIDSRAELYKDEFIKNYQEAVTLTGGEKTLEKLLKEYDASWTFLMPNSPAIAYFNLHPDWNQVFVNKYWVIHVRKGRWSDNTVSAIKVMLENQFEDDEDASAKD